ncbi:MAG: ureidoglycolate lyase [Rhizobiaceae bacterium]|nr:ureidoglycolate lyase [Hyphomicrobiales bacterium]NRB30160.1 ureidoglycolate lyase [Rhizobiaceae bacterium]
MALIAQPLTKERFADYGQVIEKDGSESFLINNGNCRRHHALATAEIAGPDCKVGISIFAGQPYELPLQLSLVERHPLGSQAFYPLGDKAWLVIVCDDDNGTPVSPKVFLASSDQGISLNRGVWHGVLTPLHEACDFLVVDRIGEGNNLEEHTFDTPYQVDLAASA